MFREESLEIAVMIQSASRGRRGYVLTPFNSPKTLVAALLRNTTLGSATLGSALHRESPEAIGLSEASVPV